MDIDAKKRIAVVGPSGVGKSSIVQAILGFYPFSAGKITINETPVQDTGFELIRQNICTVLQQPAIFNDTIRNNIVIAWNFFSDESREIFKETIQLDKNTWIRALGWALWKTLCWPVKGTDVQTLLNVIYREYQTFKI
jgi:ABC-type multidrug transport system fused ATPase/permease subunit